MNYINWYNQPENDTRQGQYAAMFRTFDAFAAPLAPGVLLTSIATGRDSKTAFATLSPEGLIGVVHRIKRMTPITGEEELPHNRITTAIWGDVTDYVTTFVEVPAGALTRTEVIERVLTPEAINRRLEVAPEATQLAIDPNAPNVDVGIVRSRYYMAIPPSMVGQVLAAAVTPGGLTPRDLWINITGPMAEDEQLRADCAPFIDWCRLAVAHGVGEGNLLQMESPPPVRLHPELLQFRIDSLRQDLPGRDAAVQPNRFEHLAPIVDALGNVTDALTAHVDAAAEQAELRREANTLPSQRWSANIETLLTICKVLDELDLPPIWLELAKSTSKKDRATIQHHFRTREPRLGNSGRAEGPICSIALARAIVNLEFQSGEDDLETGVTIFNVSYPGQTTIARVNASTGLYDQQMEGGLGVTVSDQVTMAAAQAFELPTSLLQLKHVCWAYHRLLAVILGVEHDVTTAFGRFVTSLEWRETSLDSYFSNRLDRCAGVLRYIQLLMHEWTVAILDHQDPVAPNFIGLLQLITMRQWEPNTLPAAFQERTRTATKRNNANRSTGQSGVVAANQAHLDKKLVPIQANFQPALFISKHGTPPSNDNGGEMCLSYHVGASCRRECTRLADHRKHTHGESTRLAEYMASPAK